MGEKFEAEGCTDWKNKKKSLQKMSYFSLKISEEQKIKKIIKGRHVRGCPTFLSIFVRSKNIKVFGLIHGRSLSFCKCPRAA